MFGFFNRLTYASNNYIDWSRIGELIKSGKHKYSNEEILTRSAIVATTALSGYLAMYFNDKSYCSNVTMAIAGGTLGFIVSHSIVIVPLVYKRYKASQECNELAAQIKVQGSDFKSHTQETIQETIHSILNLSMATTERSNASMTWGHRKMLLKRFHQGLLDENDNLLTALDQGDPQKVIQLIENKFELISHQKHML